MAVDLGDFTASLVRAVTPLGGTVSANTDTLIGHLTDAFWEARLDGFMAGYEATEEGVITPVVDGAPDLDRRWIALIIMYASMKVLQNNIVTANSVFRAKAGPVEFEQQSSASTMTEMLRNLRASKAQLLTDLRAEDQSGATNVHMVDAFLVREWRSLTHGAVPHLLGS